ncbi:arginine--tRNA ligase [Streptomyces rapamycinicus NRRL 5491]|uniref:ArgS-related anticodon-binding protein NrtL n=1 Tax=Streptomyces rapamycinicus TaxID=1226757 RepID=UPI0003F637C9|nr:DALR anticodon-binding domain-containing protein [Streptomyces rapamycinicus]UTO63030.1 arginine--tRNA ligase [Streptomyces rapamycinicus]UTP30989.1 arginine--tRNA ligase [Streptomyces rapamycinicus NRRL 5491]
MTPAQLSRTVLHTVRRAVEDDELCVAVPERVKVRTPPRPGCGDYATNVALLLARGGGDALGIAEVLRRRLVRTPGIARVDVAAPGFLNITLDASSHAQLVRDVLSQRSRYGHGEALVGVSVPLGASGEVRAALVAHVVRGLVHAVGGVVVPGHGPVVRPVPASGAELLRSLGSDAARWALLRSAGHDLPDLAPSRLLSQREGNPLFRVQYAHARTRALMRNASQLGIAPESGAGVYDHPAEIGLLALLADHPRTIEAAARHRAPDQLARHLVAVADAFFRFHDRFSDDCPVLPSHQLKPSAAHRSRLALADATGVVLAGGLRLLGISAPEHL